MSIEERRQQFEQAVRAHPGILPEAKTAENFGFSNSARVIEGGLFAGTVNLETHSKSIVAGGKEAPLRQLVLMCVLTLPPEDEVYFAVVIEKELARVEAGLHKLYKEGEERNKKLAAKGKKTGRLNNNVKFYITESGEIFFHSYDFRETLKTAAGTDTLDPGCMAKVDSILFAIWPPAASARRSLLAREFVGYISTLIGRKNVHELRVWTDAAAVSSEMQRMPDTVSVEEIEKHVIALGGHYPHGEVRRFHAALNFLPHKHFVILSGLSGTGKTQLALKYARAVHGLKESTALDPFLFVCPVRPEWTDPTGLTGYEDVLTNRYVVPHFLEAVLRATAHPNSPVFVVLDEMNLARVEYYFSDILSVIETGEDLRLHSSSVPLEGSTGVAVQAALPMPPNLYIIGTINIDETTNPVSDKVLDRAVLIKMTDVDLVGFLAGLVGRDPTLQSSRASCEPHLLAAQKIMAPHDLGFGYRVMEEVVRYHAFATKHLKADPAAIMDDLMVQKVLVKLRGGERQRPLLTSLTKALAGLKQSETFLAKLTADLEEFGAFQASG